MITHGISKIQKKHEHTCKKTRGKNHGIPIQKILHNFTARNHALHMQINSMQKLLPYAKPLPVQQPFITRNEWISKRSRFHSYRFLCTINYYISHNVPHAKNTIQNCLCQ